MSEQKSEQKLERNFGNVLLISFQDLDIELLNKIIKEGIHYDPAWKHYDKELAVFCDHCRMRIRHCSIGLDFNNKKYDLCLACVKLNTN